MVPMRLGPVARDDRLPLTRFPLGVWPPASRLRRSCWGQPALGRAAEASSTTAGTWSPRMSSPSSQTRSSNDQASLLRMDQHLADRSPISQLPESA